RVRRSKEKPQPTHPASPEDFSRARQRGSPRAPADLLADNDVQDLAVDVDDLFDRLVADRLADAAIGQSELLDLVLGALAGHRDAPAHLAVHLDWERDHRVDAVFLVPGRPGRVR